MTGDDSDGLEPRANPSLAGHEDAEEKLRAAFDAGRLHHAWLVTGPKGIGKATLAFRFARYVLANGGPESGGLFGDQDLAGPSGDAPLYVAPDHPTFRRVAAGGHADLLTIERSINDSGKLRTEIVVDDVRRTQGFFRLTAGEGGWRVIIVDAADEMNVNAANALLKILEEPPENALLLLVCHNPGRLLATIRSRCQKLRLEPLPRDTVASLLEMRRPGVSADELEVVTGLAEGSIGRAFELLDAGGMDIYGSLMDLLGDAPNMDDANLHKFASSCGGAKGAPVFETAAGLIRWTLGRLVRFVADGGASEARLVAREADVFARLGPAASLESWLKVWEKTGEILDSADRSNLDRKQVILNTFFTIDRTVR